MHIPTLQELGVELGSSYSPNSSRRLENRKGRVITSLSLVLSDALVLTCIIVLAIYLRTQFSIGPLRFESYLPMAAIIVVGNAVVSAWRGMYPGYGFCVIAQMRSTFYSVTGVFAAAIALTFFSKEWTPYARSVVLVSYAVAVPALSLVRMGVRRILSRFAWYGTPMIVVGEHSMATRIVDTLTKHKQIGLRPLIIIEPNEQNAEYGYHKSVPIIGGLDNVQKIAERFGVQQGVLANQHSSSDEVSEILNTHFQSFTKVTIVGEHMHPSVLWVSNDRSDFLYSGQMEQRLAEPSVRMKKRLFDLVIGVPLLLAAIPVMLVLGLVTLIMMGFPIIFTQQRLGRNGRLFTVFKFRSMVNNSEEILAAHLSSNHAARKEWLEYRSLKDDPRVTRLGKILRRYSLDELPQLFNVLRGDMSLIGVRPFTMADREDLRSEEQKVSFELGLSAKPGLSGLWQVTVRNDSTFEERLNINRYYMRNWSFFLDLYILFRTVGAVVNGRGAY